MVPDEISKDRIAIPAGGLDGDPGVRPTAHIFVSSKAPWHEISDDLPQFDAYPDPDDGPNVQRPAHSQSKDGILRGSCLCGDVAYEVSTPTKRSYTIVIARAVARHARLRMRPTDLLPWTA